jgi:hypothetical protein
MSMRHKHSKEFQNRLDNDVRELQTAFTEAGEVYADKDHSALDIFVDAMMDTTADEMNDFMKNSPTPPTIMEVAEKSQKELIATLTMMFWAGYVLGKRGYEPHSCQDDHLRQYPDVN